MKRLLRPLLGVGLLVALGGILAAQYQRDPEFFYFKWKVNREPPLEVKFVPAARGRVIRTIEAPGKIEADIEVKVSSQVMGKIVKLPVKEGDSVRSGALLVQLDPVQYEAEVRGCEARIRRLKSSIGLAETDCDKSKRDMELFRRLYGERASNYSEMKDAETTHHKDLARLVMAREELKDAESSLTRAKEDLEHTTIRSTIDGVVSQLLAKEGEMVVVGTMNNAGTVILSVSEPNSMVARARVDENNVALVQPGQRAHIYLQNDNKLVLTGTVQRICPKGTKGGGGSAGNTTTAAPGDNDVSIFETVIRLDSPPPQVRLGMTSNVEIQVDERDDVLTIPTQSVLHRRVKDLPRNLQQELDTEGLKYQGVKDPSRRYHQVVFVRADGQARCRLVKTGISDDNRVEILSGLAEGDEVIAGPYRVFDKLKDGKPVVEATEKDAANE